MTTVNFEFSRNDNDEYFVNLPVLLELTGANTEQDKYLMPGDTEINIDVISKTLLRFSYCYEDLASINSIIKSRDSLNYFLSNNGIKGWIKNIINLISSRSVILNNIQLDSLNIFTNYNQFTSVWIDTDLVVIKASKKHIFEIMPDKWLDKNGISLSEEKLHEFITEINKQIFNTSENNQQLVDKDVYKLALNNLSLI